MHSQRYCQRARRRLPPSAAVVLRAAGGVTPAGGALFFMIVGRTGSPVFEGGPSDPKPVAVGLAATIAQGQGNTPKGDQPRSERGREGMEPEGCESPTGRGTRGAPALVTLPQYASPGVGPMGARYPADAGPRLESPDERTTG